VTKPEEKVDEPKKPAEKETERSLFEPVVIQVKKPVAPAKGTDRTADPDDKNVAGRSRVVGDKKVASEKLVPPCDVIVSQENISLIADGGSIGVLVGVDGDVDLKLLAAAPSGPKDVEVIRQPEIAGVSGRAYFVVKSLTNAAGDYKIIFAAPCGKKEVNVKVR
jgi:hypothetical protein